MSTFKRCACLGICLCCTTVVAHFGPIENGLRVYRIAQRQEDQEHLHGERMNETLAVGRGGLQRASITGAFAPSIEDIRLRQMTDQIFAKWFKEYLRTTRCV